MSRIVAFLTRHAFAALMAVGSIAVVASLARLALVSLSLPDPADPFDQRYLDHPVVSFLHILPGLLFLLIGPFQFRPGLRQRAPRLHRVMGRVFVACGLISALSVMWLVLAFPAQGGAVTIAAIWVFAPWMIWALWQAFRHARARDIACHRAWMIRAYAVGLSVASIRLLGILGELTLGYGLLDHFQWYTVTGLCLHVAGAEWLLRQRGLLPRRRAAATLS